MEPAPFTFSARQGSTWAVSMTVDDDGTPVSWTGTTAKMQLRRSVSDPAVALECSTANGRITLTDPTGLLQINVDAVTMAAMEPGRYVYDLELTRPGGVVEPLLAGDVRIAAEVTR